MPLMAIVEIYFVIVLFRYGIGDHHYKCLLNLCAGFFPPEWCTSGTAFVRKR